MYRPGNLYPWLDNPEEFERYFVEVHMPIPKLCRARFGAAMPSRPISSGISTVSATSRQITKAKIHSKPPLRRAKRR